MRLGEDVELEEIARMTYGFVGADLTALAREAAIEALRGSVQEIDCEAKETPAAVLAGLRVMRDDFLGALKRIHPSALREIMIQVPDVGWDDVGGLDEAKAALPQGIGVPLGH